MMLINGHCADAACALFLLHFLWLLCTHFLCVCYVDYTCTSDASLLLIQLSFGQYDFFWSLASLMLMLTAATDATAATAARPSALHCWPRPSGAGRAAFLSSRSRSHFSLTSVESSAMKAEQQEKNML